MIATAHVMKTATDWVRLGEKRITILVWPVEQVESNITGSRQNSQGSDLVAMTRCTRLEVDRGSQSLIVVLGVAHRFRIPGPVSECGPGRCRGIEQVVSADMMWAAL